jgi:HK97 family phage major capsid protein
MKEIDALESELRDPNCPRHKRDLYASSVAEAKALNRDLEAATEHQRVSDWANKSERQPTRPGPWIDSSGTGKTAFGTRTGANGSYRSLFGEPAPSGFKNFDDFLETLQSRVGDPRIVRAIGEGRPGDGGALVPTEYSAQLLDAALEGELVRPRATVYAMASNTRKIPGTVIGSHASTLFGGVAGGFVAEGAEMTESDPKFRSIELVARKLACYSLSSLEWWDDGVGAAGVIANILSKALAFFADEAYIRGTGSGGRASSLRQKRTVRPPTRSIRRI